MINIENVLRDHGIGVGISKQKYLDMERRAVNGEAVLDIVDRTQDATAFFYDLFDNTNDHSCGVIDTTKTTAISTLTAGDTNLISKVDISTALTKWFQTGQEITIADDVNFERVIISNGGISTSSVTYDRSTPTTVVAQTYTTSKDARPQVLSNGWHANLLFVSQDAGYIIRISEDNGVNWRQLCSIDGGVTNIVGASLCSYGTTLYVLLPYSTSVVNFYKINALTQTDVNIYSTGLTYNLDTVTTQDKTTITVNSTGTELHASWSCIVPAYPNSKNIRYAKGTISAVDGSVSWGSVEQLSIYNTTGTDAKNPVITIQNNLASIAYEYSVSGVVYRIDFKKWNGSLWNTTTIYSGLTYAQSSPDILTDQNGILKVVWHGNNANGYWQVNYSESIDGGITWSSMIRLSAVELYSNRDATITFDKDNNTYVLWRRYDVSVWNLQKIINDEISWGNIVSTTSSNVGVPSVCSNYQDFTDPICIYQDNQTPSVKFRGIFTQTTQVPHLEVTPLVNSYKTNVLIYRSLGNVDTVNGTLGFSQGFYNGSAYQKLLSEDIRYNITPSANVSQIADWTQYQIDAGFSIDTKFSLVASNVNESFGTPTKKTTLVSTGINEDQNIYVASSNSRITKRLTISRTSTSDP